MHKNKVVLILKSLSSDNIRHLDKFVQSPAHNSHEDVTRLFQYLRKHLTNGEKALKRENVFLHLFPGQPFDMQKVHYVNSYLLRVVEEFLAWRQWRGNEADYQLYLLRALRLHRIDGSFDGVFEKAKTALDQLGPQGVDSLFHDYQLELERFNQDRLKTGRQEFRLQEMSGALDALFIAEKLRNACILLSNQHVSKTSYDMGLLDPVLLHLQGHPLLEQPVIAIYYHACRTLKSAEDDEAFRALKKLLEEHRKSFKLNELHDIYIFSINYCIRRLNSGHQGFMREMFDIFRMGLETDAFVQNGIMTPRTYSNIIMSGLKLNEFDWVGHFIYQYREALPVKQREGFFNYNLARFYYEQKNYGEAMPLLLQMDYDDMLLTCLGKILLAKMHYEQQELDSLHSLLSSFRVYVQRKKMPNPHHDSYQNFIHFLTKLLQRVPGSVGQLAKDIAETKPVAEKEWLLAQL